MMQLTTTLRHLFYTMLTIFLLAACNNSESHDAATHTQAPVDSLTRIKDYGAIRVGIFADNPPFGDIDDKGNYYGFEVEIAKALANDLLGSPDKVEFILTRADERIPSLDSGKIDVLLATFSQIPERANKVIFIEPYIKVALGVMSHNSDPITHISQLRGRKIGAIKGMHAEEYFRQNHPEIEVVAFERRPEALQALRNGEIVAFTDDNFSVWADVHLYPEFVVGINAIGDYENVGPAVKKGDPVLANWANERIQAMRKDGRLKQAYDKTIKPTHGNDVVDLLIK